MPLASARAPPAPLFQWTDGLRALISPHNVQLHADTAIPTNDWWGNLLAWDPAHARDSDPIFANPYVYHVAHSRGLALGYLHDYRVDGPMNENGAIKYYFYPATTKNVVFSAAEWAGGSTIGMQIESWDDLGVSLQLARGASAGYNVSPAQSIRGYLSMGNAFTTLEYHGHLHAQIQSDHAILQVNYIRYEEGAQLENSMFEVVYNNGQKWIFFFFPRGHCGLHQGTTTRVVMQHNTLTTTQPFDGVVQAAYVSSQKSREQDPEAERRIIALYRSVAGVFPTGAKVFTGSDGESFGFDWTLKNVRSTEPHTCASETHLHFALTHLQTMMDSTFVIRKPELQLWSHTRGPMQAYTLRGGAPGAKWRFIVPPATSDAVNNQATNFIPTNAHIPRHVVDQINLVNVVTHEILHSDWNRDLPREGSYYFKGKALQKFATVVLVAKILSESTSPELKPVFVQGVEKLRTIMKNFAKNQEAYPLVYDTVYKGIITSEALHKRDFNVDFGNAAYNDHHYHYGYLITAAAMLLYLDQGEGARHGHRPEDYAELRVFVETLIRDVVNPDVGDKYFPRFRLFNWFLGHSYSHGVTPMADGKDEESTSEEVNFLYGLALYSHVTETRDMENLAKLMLKVNTLAIETYFLISDDRIGTIHPASFGKNKVTGICFDNKCDYATWFSPARECIHGIQMIPVSPMLDVVRTRQFIQEEWDQILGQLPCVKQWETSGSGWTSLLYSNAAVLFPDQALHVLAKCQMDDGLSRAWALFMAATKFGQR